MEFTSTIKDFLIQQLEDSKGYNFEAYDSFELANKMTESINIDGSVHCSAYKAREFIKENFDEFGEIVKYYNEEFGETLNPLSEPEKAEVIAYIFTCERLLAECENLQKLFDESEYNSITVDEKVIDIIISELNDINIDVFGG